MTRSPSPTTPRATTPAPTADHAATDKSDLAASSAEQSVAWSVDQMQAGNGGHVLFPSCRVPRHVIHRMARVVGAFVYQDFVQEFRLQATAIPFKATECVNTPRSKA